MANGSMNGRCKRQNGNITCPFESDRYLSLVLRTVSRDPSRNDLSPFRYEISENPRIFIVDIQFFIGAESTDLSPHKRFFLPVGSRRFSRFPHSFLLSLLTGKCPASPAVWAGSRGTIKMTIHFREASSCGRGASPILPVACLPQAGQTVVWFNSSNLRRSVAITSVRVRFFPSGVCQCR